MGWAHNFKPPSGMPASGMPATGLPATGAGEWGAAKGSGNIGRAPMITTETAFEMQALRGTPEAEAKRERRIATAQELKERLSEIAMTTTIEANAIRAIEGLLDRIEGKPIQPTVDLSPDVRRVVADKPMSIEEWTQQHGAANDPLASGNVDAS